ncbi:hypothetical protein As57867_007184, partial [Aphanomyces stellatus]
MQCATVVCMVGAVAISAVFATLFLALNSIYAISIVVLGPAFGSPWVGWDHELVILGMLLRMEFRRAEFHRSHAAALNTLA